MLTRHQQKKPAKTNKQAREDTRRLLSLRLYLVSENQTQEIIGWLVTQIQHGFTYNSSRHPSILSDNGKRHGSGHVVLSPVKARLKWPLQGASLGKDIWRPCAAHTTRPPSRPHWPDPRECRAIHLGSAWLQELPEGSHHWHPAAWGTLLLICILNLLP